MLASLSCLMRQFSQRFFAPATHVLRLRLKPSFVRAARAFAKFSATVIAGFSSDMGEITGTQRLLSSVDWGKRLRTVRGMVAEAPSELLGRATNQEISHRLRAQVRTLYLVEGHNPKSIEALGLGLTAKQISNLAWAEGWTQKRKQAALQVKETSEARANAAVSAVAEAIAIESEELCFKALNQTRAGLDKGGLEGAKQAQAASSTLRNLNSVAQAIRKPELANGDERPTSFNLFFIGAPNSQSAKVAEQIEVKNVTD